MLTPETYGSLGLATAAGHNLAAGWATLLRGGDPRRGPTGPASGLRCEEREAPALVATVLAGAPAAALRALRPGGRRHGGALEIPALLAAWGEGAARRRSTLGRRPGGEGGPPGAAPRESALEANRGRRRRPSSGTRRSSGNVSAITSCARLSHKTARQAAAVSTMRHGQRRAGSESAA